MVSLPDPVLNELRCYKCKNVLSCKPISITNKGESLCGRCRRDRPVIQAHAYECVADYFLFPCKNWEKHCAYLLNIKDVTEHEKDCSFGDRCSLFCFNPGSLCKPNNKLDLEQNLKFYNIPDEEVLATLTCLLCGYYLSSCPIHVNAEGYSVCHRCYTTKEGKVPPNYVRHFALETILQIFLFPCVYRKRGCTKVFRYGYDSDHEKMCSYSKTQKSFATFTDPNNGKQKGVIETHTGHMFGTITPYSQFFSLQHKASNDSNYRGVEPIKVMPNEKQERFYIQLLKHRESLQYQWNRNSKIDGANSPPKLPLDFNKDLIEGNPENFDGLPNKSSFRNDTNSSFDHPSFRRDTKSNVDRQNSYKNESSSSKDEGFIEEQQNIRLSPPLNDDYDLSDPMSSNRNDNIPPNRRHQSGSSGSDTFNSRSSPANSLSSQPNGNRSPLKLNPADLMHSNSVNYSERLDRIQSPDRKESFSSNRPDNKNISPRVHQNPSFMY